MNDYELKQKKYYVEKVEGRGTFKALVLPAIFVGLFMGLMTSVLDYSGDSALNPEFLPYLISDHTLVQAFGGGVAMFLINLWSYKSAKKTIAQEEALRSS